LAGALVVGVAWRHWGEDRDLTHAGGNRDLLRVLFQPRFRRSSGWSQLREPWRRQARERQLRQMQMEFGARELRRNNGTTYRLDFAYEAGCVRPSADMNPTSSGAIFV
jgi:hypothetical protein